MGRTAIWTTVMKTMAAIMTTSIARCMAATTRNTVSLAAMMQNRGQEKKKAKQRSSSRWYQCLYQLLRPRPRITRHHFHPITHRHQARRPEVFYVDGMGNRE